MLAYDDRLPHECWLLLEDRVPRPWYISTKLGEGDLIALAVVNLFIDRSFSPRAFNKLTANDALFSHLLELASLRYRSRRFLVQLQSFLSTERDGMGRFRLKRIKEVLD
jgi:hypothetical protein